jgi:hypothetical protein
MRLNFKVVAKTSVFTYDTTKILYQVQKLTMLVRVISVSMGVVSLDESAFGVSASLAVSSPWRDILIAYAIWSASDIMLEKSDGV